MVYNVLDSLCVLQKLMGKNFVDPLGWHRSLNMPLSEEQRREILRFPWSLSLLEESCPFQPGKKIAETHMLFWGFPQISILSLAKLYSVIRLPDYGVTLALSKISALGQSLEARWHLMPLRGQSIVDDQAIPLEEHLEMIPSAYSLSFAVEEIAKQFFYQKLNEQYPVDGILYDYQLMEKVFNKAYKLDRNQPKFVDQLVDFSGPRQLFFRCVDRWANKASVSVTHWDAKNGISVLPFPDEPLHAFPIALSLGRNYPH